MEGSPPIPPRKVSYWEIFFVVGAYALPLTLESLFGAMHPGQMPVRPEYADWSLVIHAARSVTMLGLLTLFIRRGGETLRDFTEPSWRLGNLGWGILLSILCYLLLWPSYYLSRALHLDRLGGPEYDQNLDFLKGHVGIAFLVMILTNPFAEEGFMRAYLQTRLRQKGWGAVMTVSVSVLLQTGYHLYQGIPACVSHLATFLVFALYYQKTRRIWPVVTAHLILDALAMAQFAK